VASLHHFSGDLQKGGGAIQKVDTEQK